MPAPWRSKTRSRKRSPTATTCGGRAVSLVGSLAEAHPRH
jgi:hypothetical protein